MRYHVVAFCEWVIEMDWDRISRVTISNNVQDGYFLAGLKKSMKNFKPLQTVYNMMFETEPSRIQLLKVANFNSTFGRCI